MADAPNGAPTPTSMSPHPKVVIGTLAGGLTAIIVWVLNNYAHANISGEIASGITVVISQVIAYLIPAGSQQ